MKTRHRIALGVCSLFLIGAGVQALMISLGCFILRPIDIVVIMGTCICTSVISLGVYLDMRKGVKKEF